MIEIITGHLGCGCWHLKKIGSIPVLSNMQLLSQRDEFRIGPDQVIAVTKVRDEKKKVLVDIQFTQERHCQALINPTDFPILASMVNMTDKAPATKNQPQLWIISLAIVFLISIIVEILK